MESKSGIGARLEPFWARWGWLLLVGAAALVFVGVWMRARGGGAVGEDLSAVAYVDASGARHTLAEHRGKVVVVDVWATWCPPCRRSLPEIGRLQAQADAHYTVLALSIDDHGFDDIRPFFQAHPELKLDAVVPADLGPLGPVNIVPTTVVLDPQGRVRARWSGYRPGLAEQALKAALGS
ncbi:MAG TPA: redoxin family protein [Holophagaceae bacterium]|nr:redoxin family protein [Holophagaceae bacterium]